MGLEPTRLAAQEPKSCMSANSIMTAGSGEVTDSPPDNRE